VADARGGRAGADGGDGEGGEVGALNDVLTAVRGTLSEWLQLRWSDLRFIEPLAGFVLVAILLGTSLALLLTRGRVRPGGVRQIVLPAILPAIPRPAVPGLRHAAIALFALGIPFFALAVADPRVTVVREGVMQPGQRIAILIDGSGSMVLPFEAPRLQPAMNRTFYTAVAAAERFVRLRMAGHHADITAVIEFGSEAFVVTPFTTDAENVILSLRLIGEPRAWNGFNVFGTTIVQGIDQGLQLFSTFDVLTTSGNMIVLLTDGNDGETMFRGRTLAQMMDDARSRKIPVYMVRLGFEKRLGDGTWDALWKSAVERAGGRFYAAFDEASLLRALADIDRLSTARIAVRHYSTATPAFPGYALVASALWLTAAALKLAVPYFRTFP
jgi:VWA domain-containing protein